MSKATTSEAVSFLKKQGKFYLATIKDNKPRVRPFGAVTEFENKMYFSTSSTRDLLNQFKANSNVSVCVCDENRKWLRIEGAAKVDERKQVRQAMLKDNPVLAKYFKSVDDPTFATFYIDVENMEFCD